MASPRGSPVCMSVWGRLRELSQTLREEALQWPGRLICSSRARGQRLRMRHGGEDEVGAVAVGVPTGLASS